MALEESVFDLVLLDLRCPVKRFEILQAIRAGMRTFRSS